MGRIANIRTRIPFRAIQAHGSGDHFTCGQNVGMLLLIAPLTSISLAVSLTRSWNKAAWDQVAKLLKERD